MSRMSLIIWSMSLISPPWLFSSRGRITIPDISSDADHSGRYFMSPRSGLSRSGVLEDLDVADAASPELCRHLSPAQQSECPKLEHLLDRVLTEVQSHHDLDHASPPYR